MNTLPVMKIYIRLLPVLILSLIACKPEPPLIILHNSCSGYTSLRHLQYPTSYTKTLIDSLGFSYSLDETDTANNYMLDTRIYIHPEDMVWMKELDSIFPNAQVMEADTKGEVHIWTGINGLAFDTAPFTRMLLVLNGTPKPGLARDAAYRFNIRFGISSLEPQTADADTFSQTTLYCAEKDAMLAQKLIDYLGIGKVALRKRMQDMVLLLGLDIMDTKAIKSSPPRISLVIKKGMFQMLVFKKGKLIKTYPIAIGKNKGDKQRKGDMRTPEGNFTIVSIEDSHTWEHDFGDGNGPIKGAYGPWFLRLSTLASETRSGKAWTGIGIHGTHDNASIGTRASEGCIRMHNEDIKELKKMVRVGTPVRIEE